MSSRFLTIAAALALLITLPAAGQTKGSAAQSKSAKSLRAADGHPDLQGVWTNATITPLERPKALAGKATLTDAEAAEFEKNAAKELQDVDGKSESPLLAAAGSNGTGGYNILFIDRGSELARVDGVKRTSLIIDPPDGKIPPTTRDAKKRNAETFQSYITFNKVKDGRCRSAAWSGSDPPPARPCFRCSTTTTTRSSRPPARS
jgi:hypothetical protein